MPLRLLIGNRNYSSWSMRAWVLMREAGIPFDEVMVRFDGFEADSAFKTSLSRVGVAGRVPVLIDEDLAVWDSLAIAEYLAERFPDRGLWPEDRRARARARSVCAEMHSGFEALRGACPMNIEASLPEVGARILRENAGVVTDLERLARIWGDCLEDSGGPMLFGRFSVADAFFAPVAMRLRTYGLPVPGPQEAYVARLAALPAVREWIGSALAERDFRPFEEPYRSAR